MPPRSPLCVPFTPTPPAGPPLQSAERLSPLRSPHSPATLAGKAEPEGRGRGRLYVRTWRCARVRGDGTCRRGSMAEWRAVPSDLFPFVLAFLRENRFDGAARAFAKEAAAVSGGVRRGREGKGAQGSAAQWLTD